MFESRFITHYPCLLVASDEAGRGPLAGPVSAASVACPLNAPADLKKILKALKAWGVNDSKKISEKKRQEIANEDFSSLGLRTHITLISPEIIDEINILAASLLAMSQSARECVSSLKKLPVMWLVDGNKKPKCDLPWQCEAIVKGDSKSSLIGLASVLAKVKRDQVMDELHLLYPQYGFSQHAGYPTQAHRQSLALYGPSPVHRKTFKGVREYL